MKKMENLMHSSNNDLISITKKNQDDLLSLSKEKQEIAAEKH